jgi:hypothetical protein
MSLICADLPLIEPSVIQEPRPTKFGHAASDLPTLAFEDEDDDEYSLPDEALADLASNSVG